MKPSRQALTRIYVADLSTLLLDFIQYAKLSVFLSFYFFYITNVSYS